MSKVIKIVLIGGALLLILVACGIVSYLGYLGFLPGVSSLFGSNKPVDLGVTYSKDDFDSYNSKTGTTIVVVDSGNSPEESIKFTEPKELVVEMTQEECSARIAYAEWKYMPISQPQVRFNGDGSVEASGILVKENVLSFLQAVGYSNSDFDQVNDYLGKLPIDPAIYIKGVPTVSDNVATIDITELKVGNLSIDTDSYDGDSLLSTFASEVMNSIDGFNARNVDFKDGSVSFGGTAPTMIEVQGK